MKNSIVILLALTLTTSTFSQSKECKEYVKACEKVIEAQDVAIVNLKKSVKNLSEQLEDQKSGLKWWHGALVGILLGIAVTKVNK